MLFNKLARATLWLVFLLIPHCAMGSNSFIESKEFHTLENEIKEILLKHKLTGFQLSLNASERVMWTMNHGLASVSSNVDVSDETLFRIASISKTVTAVAVMQLVEQGKLNLTEPINTYIPEIEMSNDWQESTPITVLHLLEHTAGFDDNHFTEYVVDGSGMSTKDALDYHPHTRVSRYEPGLFMSYANIDPTLLAYIVEKISGLPFEEYVQRHIFMPLHMPNSDYFFSDHVRNNLATGYMQTDGGSSIADYEYIKDRASGAIVSNVNDMSNFQRMLINFGRHQGQRILAQGSIARMSITESTLAAKAGFQEGYGKFMITQHSLGKKWLGHNGEMNGYLSAMWHNPERQAGYIFFSNTNGERAYEADREINKVLRRFILKNFPETVAKKAQNSAKTNHLTQYNKQILGSYRHYTSRLALFGFIEGLESFSSVFVEDDVVKIATSHSTYSLLPVGQNVFISQLTNGDEIKVIFVEYEGQWYYQIPSIFINAIQTSPVIKVASYALLVGFVLMTVVIFTMLIVKLLSSLLGYPFSENDVLGWIIIGNMGLLSCLILLGAAGNTGMPQNVLGQPNIYSLGISISLLVFFIFTVISIFKFWKKSQKATFNTTSKLVRYVAISAILTNVVMLSTLSYFNFLFVALWQY
jgi:CubicO group peptidase (beta-lactamase class C family)